MQPAELVLFFFVFRASDARSGHGARDTRDGGRRASLALLARFALCIRSPEKGQKIATQDGTYYVVQR